jgi:hypothetical protein
MASAPRLGRGHVLTSIAVLVRRASIPLVLVALAVLALAGIAPPGGRASAPTWAVVGPLSVFIASRLAAVGLAMVGWLMFPPEHRALLGAVAERARDGSHSRAWRDAVSAKTIGSQA